MMRFLTIIFFVSFIFNVNAQEFATTKITPVLRKNANVIIRNDETTIDVKSETKVAVNYKTVFTILNKQGNDYNTLAAYYDKESALSDIKAVLYDSLGFKIKEYSKSDFADQSQISDFSIYDDNRVKYLKVDNNKYPYTVEFSYSQNYNSNLYIPSWYPQNDFHIAVEKSNFRITYPKSSPIRYKESKITKGKKLEEGDKESLIFSCNNVSAIDFEELTTGIDNISPWARISSSTFTFDNTKGDFSTWNSFGKWIYDLSNNLDVLPPDVAKTVHDLTDGVADPKEKTKILYHYLQNKTRYISVQLGIGGFKPFPASKVAVNNYGDCKALSNYMKALLNEAKIPSQLVMVKAGKNKNILADFSSLQANHMILCVPFPKDTVWLECTSQKAAFNYLGSFTENRNVVLISENGGKLVKTPTYLPKDNFQIRKAMVKIAPNGDATCSINTDFGGEQFEDHEYQLYQEPKNQKESIYENIAIANPEIIDFSYFQKDKDSPELLENINLKVTKLMNGVGNNLFLTLNLMNKRQYVPKVYENRRTNFSINYSYTDVDEITYELPSNFKVSFIPKDQEIITDFGTYKIQTKIEGNKLIYKREQIMFKKDYQPEKYNDLISFYKAIYKADKQKAVIDIL